MADAKRSIQPPRRPPAALDDISDHMGEVLRRADELLVEWSRFGAEVRAQVDREALEIGHVVSRSVEGAVGRATTAGIDRAMAEQIGTKLSSLAAEIGRLEGRARAASRAIVEERAVDRRLLWGVAAGVLVANGLLVALLWTRPQPGIAAQPPGVPVHDMPIVAPIDAAPAPEPSPVSDPAPAEVAPESAPSPPPVSSGKDKGSGAPPTKVVKPGRATAPALRAVKIGPPAGQPKRR